MGTLRRTCPTAPRRGPLPKLLWANLLTVGLTLRLRCSDLPSSLTERTSDNQHLGTSNDATSVTKHPTLKSQIN